MEKAARDIVGEYSKTCQVDGCKNHAAYRVDGLVWPKGHTDKKKHKPAQVHIGISVCEEHKDFPTPQNVLTPEAKGNITGIFHAQGYVPPAWKTLELKLVPLTAEDLGEAVQ